MNKRNKKEMKDLVGRYFIRVCKNHNIYSRFRSYFYKVMNSNGDRNPFGNFSNIEGLFDKLEIFTEKEYQNHRRTNDKYERVTMMINHMLHFFLEKGGVDPRKLGKIGQEIFDLSCYGLYGDAFLSDMDKMKQEIPKQPKNDKEVWLFREYLRHKANGMTSMSWEEFREHYLPMIDDNFSIECNSNSNDIPF